MYPNFKAESTVNDPVYQNEATYYNPVSKRWQNGTFILRSSHFEFITEKNCVDTQFHLSFPLCTISEIIKKQVKFVYSAVVISVGVEKHWFASFPNRDSIYNLIELFWRNSLFAKRSNVNGYSNVKTTPTTPLGNRLLCLLRESEETLIGAANSLQDQGQQLNETEEYVEELNSDLTTAEKFINQVKDLPLALKSDNNTSDEMQLKTELKKRRYEVTFMTSDVSNCDINDWEKGTLVVAEELVLLDEKENSRFYIPINELKEIKVVAPWELCVTQVIDRREIKFNIMCPNLSRLLKTFSSMPSYSIKVVYDDDGDNSSARFDSSSSSSDLSMVSALSSLPSPTVSTPEMPSTSSQMQKTQVSESLTDEEIKEISVLLNKLHTLAAEVSSEQQSQAEKIERLVTEVEKTELRANVDCKEIKKL